jgi:NAD(P)-dependent dehydrogenase (short-subunit alcohol dehydrogenase family)
MTQNSKIAIVTGAGSGIGKATAMALLHDGWSVVLAGRRQVNLEEVVEEAKALNAGSRVLAVPTDKILSIYTQWQKPEDLNPLRLKTIAHFFEHYKDLEVGKWVKIIGWEGPEAAKKEILDGIANYQKENA